VVRRWASLSSLIVRIEYVFSRRLSSLSLSPFPFAHHTHTKRQLDIQKTTLSGPGWPVTLSQATTRIVAGTAQQFEATAHDVFGNQCLAAPPVNVTFTCVCFVLIVCLFVLFVCFVCLFCLFVCLVWFSLILFFSAYRANPQLLVHATGVAGTVPGFPIYACVCYNIIT
jgi:hypothetical protein